MSERDNKDLLFPPLFSEALSGNFALTTTAHDRVKSLRELACTAFALGTINVTDYETDHCGFSYRPTWAPNVEATVICERFGMASASQPGIADHTTLKAKSLILIGAGGKEDLSVHNREVENEQGYTEAGLLVVRSFTKLIEAPLQLGQEFEQVQKIITQQAQDFFDKAS